ncbi:molybdopterin synthase sulfur carrier subunit [Toxorhynchites rutilus septentrionalis]|uniref:molybdopterin synthase sulfur carrier subunit n=1 Tax=Toxorhynchites rutilus septentrionalis TaxID=329112 RepID=UPI00247A8BC3|nr:molybdopterin synthase sulfur carrier subunit [Toxorhynchites rutilus septentrionalis]
MNQSRSSVVRVNLLFFAKSRELVGTSTCPNFVLATSGGSLSGSGILDSICEQFPALMVLRNNVIIAHNEEYCEDLDALVDLEDGDEIAVIPPIAGG